MIEERLHDLWDLIKKANIWVFRIPGRWEDGAEILLKEIVAENLPNWGKI